MNQRCPRGQCLNHNFVQSQSPLMQKPRIEQPWSGPTRSHHPILNAPIALRPQRSLVEKGPRTWAEFKDLRVKKPMNRNYDAMSSPPQCSQRCNFQKGLKRERPTQSKLKAKWEAQINSMQPESHYVYKPNKKGNHSNACRDLW